MKIIVTGSEGLLGKEIVNYLEKNNDVVKLDLVLGHDLTDETFVKKWFKKKSSFLFSKLFCLK